MHLNAPEMNGCAAVARKIKEGRMERHDGGGADLDSDGKGETQTLRE